MSEPIKLYFHRTLTPEQALECLPDGTHVQVIVCDAAGLAQFQCFWPRDCVERLFRESVRVGVAGEQEWQTGFGLFVRSIKNHEKTEHLLFFRTATEPPAARVLSLTNPSVN